MCSHCEQEMQYALMEIMKDRRIIVDALEYGLIDQVLESGNIQNELDQLDNNKIKYNEAAPLKIVHGVIRKNPHFSENLTDYITKNYINKQFTTYLESQTFHDFGLIDIVIYESDKDNHTPFSALICADFDIDNTSKRATTAFVSYGDLSIFESLLNREFILSITQQSEFVEDLNETNWKNYILN